MHQSCLLVSIQSIAQCKELPSPSHSGNRNRIQRLVDQKRSRPMRFHFRRKMFPTSPETAMAARKTRNQSSAETKSSLNDIMAAMGLDSVGFDSSVCVRACVRECESCQRRSRLTGPKQHCVYHATSHGSYARCIASKNHQPTMACERSRCRLHAATLCLGKHYP